MSKDKGVMKIGRLNEGADYSIECPSCRRDRLTTTNETLSLR